MRILLAILLLSSTFIAAQESPTQAPNRDPNPQSTRPASYEGCVIRENGKIKLTDPSNIDYILVSSARSLESYVGQEVRVTATPMKASDPSSDEKSVGSGEPQNRPKTLDVAGIAKVADHCTSPK